MKNTNRYLLKVTLFLLGIICLPFLKLAGQGWSPEETLLDENGVKVLIQYRESNNSCDTGGKLMKFRYNLISKAGASETFVQFDVDYIDCQGFLITQTFSENIGQSANQGIIEVMDNRFAAKKITNRFYNVKINPVRYANLVKKQPLTSEPATRIKGKTNVFYNQENTFKVDGGLLGMGASWVWYKNAVGSNPIAKGESAIIKLTENATIFVRAEKPGNVTNAVSLDVSVDENSSSPTKISGKVKACKGETITLKHEDGSAGKGADWHWYTGSCGGTPVYTGESYTFIPQGSNTYYVRAEGPLGNSQCAAAYVQSFNRLLDPTSLTFKKEFCEGERVSVTVNGPTLTIEEIWKAYSDACGTTEIASGSKTLDFVPSAGKSYFIRGEGTCNNTICLPAKFTVITKSTAASSISVPTNVYFRKPFDMKELGGVLGSQSKWTWYEGNLSLGSGKLLGTGETFSAKAGSVTTFSVKPEGICDKAVSHVMVTVYPIKKRDWQNTYGDPKSGKFVNKFFHIGGGIGFDRTDMSAFMDKTELHNYNNTVTNPGSMFINEMVGYGLKGELMVHPIMKKHFSFGLYAGALIGTKLSFLAGGVKEVGIPSGNFLAYSEPKEAVKEEKLGYNRKELGFEIATGGNVLKLLLNYRRSFNEVNYSNKIDYGTAYYTNNFNRKFNTEFLSMGIRFGKYSQRGKGSYKAKRSIVYDLTIIGSQNLGTINQDGIISKPFFNNFGGNSFTDSKLGFGFGWWMQSRYKVQCDILTFDMKLSDYKGAVRLGNGYVNFSLLILTDRFF